MLEDFKEKLIRRIKENYFDFVSDQNEQVLDLLKSFPITNINEYNKLRGAIISLTGVDLGNFLSLVSMFENKPELTPRKINFIDSEAKKGWLSVKTMAKDVMNKSDDLLFISTSKDTIKGKAQLLYDTKQRITLVTKVDSKGKINYKFIDDKYDRRYDGKELDSLSINFWVYRVIDNGVEYYVFSQNTLGIDELLLHGMTIEADNLSELSKTLKFRSISNLFIVKDAESSVKRMTKEELIKLTSENKITKEQFCFYFLISVS